MGKLEQEAFMEDNFDSSKKPRLNLFHRDKKTVTLPTGEKIPVVKDINAYTSNLLEEDMKAQERKTVAQNRKPLVSNLKRAVTGIISGAIRS